MAINPVFAAIEADLRVPISEPPKLYRRCARMGASGTSELLL